MVSFTISAQERHYLRELAMKQMEYASLPIMSKRKKQWLDINTGKSAIPPVVVETWTFDADFMPASVFKCESPEALHIESRLLRSIREHELINDDKAVPDYYSVGYRIDVDEFGIPIDVKYASDSEGRQIGFAHNHPICSIEEDFSKLSPLRISVDRDASEVYRKFVAELFDGILPVVVDSQPPIVDLTEKPIRLMGMEQFFISMYEEPQQVHRLMRYLTDNHLRILDFYEHENLLTVTNGFTQNGASSYSFTDELPAPGFVQGHARLKDVWLWLEAEETTAISPEMFVEFCLPYFAQIASKLGLVYYGCCENLVPIWHKLISAIPNIRKVSIAPWTNQQIMGDYLRGTGIVFSRKPYAKYLGVDSMLDETAWAEHIRETCDASHGCQLEVLIRDVYRVRDLTTVRRAVDIARNILSEHK